MVEVINNYDVCPFCGSAHINKIDETISYCMTCKQVFVTLKNKNEMKKTDIKIEDSLNKKKKSDDILFDQNSDIQNAYDAMKANIAEGYENIEAGKTFEMINE